MPVHPQNRDGTFHPCKVYATLTQFTHAMLAKGDGHESQNLSGFLPFLRQR